MSWRDTLRRLTLHDGRRLIAASFRGVPFFVASTDRGGGRRAVVHEFPQREDPYVEDLGRRARTFRMDGYVIGHDYVLQRAALLDALEDQAGPGELVHPSHGVLRAVCTNFSTSESIPDGGMAIFALEFAEAPAQAVAPVETPDPAGQVAAAGDAAVAAIEEDFELVFVSSLPAFALDSAETALENAAAALGGALAPIVATTQELATLTQQINILTSTAAALVRAPGEVLGAFRAAMLGLVETALAAPGQVLDALIEAYSADLGPDAPSTTTTRQRERANQVALQGALRTLIAIEAARLAPGVPFETLEEATATADAIADMLEEQSQAAGDSVYPALVTLRAEVLRAVPGDNVFARVLTVERRTAIPSLLLTYQLYGSVEAELDVVARNAISHPGFVAGTIKALSDVDA